MILTICGVKVLEFASKQPKPYLRMFIIGIYFSCIFTKIILNSILCLLKKILLCYWSKPTIHIVPQCVSLKRLHQTKTLVVRMEVTSLAALLNNSPLNFQFTECQSIFSLAHQYSFTVCPSFSCVNMSIQARAHIQYAA